MVPPIFRVVLSDVRESMNRVKNCVFLVRKWSYTTFNIVNIRKMWEKKEKIRRTRSMTKKKSSEIFTLKMEIFPEIGPRKNFLVPPKFGARSPPMSALDCYKLRLGFKLAFICTLRKIHPYTVLFRLHSNTRRFIIKSNGTDVWNKIPSVICISNNLIIIIIISSWRQPFGGDGYK